MNVDDAKKCNGTHSMSGLAFFTTAASAFLLISEVAVNILLIICLRRTLRTSKNRSIFYKIILNMAVADLLTGLISCPASINFHAKEGLLQEIPKHQVVVKHCGLFIVNGAAVLTMALLGFDRCVAIIFPFKYRLGMKDWKIALCLVSTWIASALLTIPYYYIGFVSYLQIFTFVTVFIALLSLVAAAIIYCVCVKPAGDVAKKHKKRAEMEGRVSVIANAGNSEGENPLPGNSLAINEPQSQVIELRETHLPQAQQIPTIYDESSGVKKDKTGKTNAFITIPKFKPGSLQKRLNSSFLIMIIVFLFTFLPAAILTVYMNACTHCNCVTIHAMRDLFYLAILSSALWRPLNFMLQLKPLRQQLDNFCGCTQAG